eukprot:TRINITY_DN5490_c0_g2_i1.p1 TRINITY_DN5490_c0_g2~~TRINITY_DN5490_c0_g2_i1.p1  ORF type:complete len:562 (+),score=45.94 TRINITY_DN5490_c0_g2_i1:167-1852(+)
MDSEDVWSAFLIGLSLLTFVVFFVALAYRTLQEGGGIDSVLERCLRALLCCKRHKRSELEAKVSSLERRRTIEFNRRTILSFSPAAAVVLYVVMMIKIFDWTSDKMVPLKDGHVACVVVGLVVSIICLIFDNQPSETLSCILHVSVMGRLAWIQASYPSGFAAFTDKQYVLMLRLAVSVMMSKHMLIYVTNLLLTGASIGTIWYHLENDEQFSRVHDEQTFLVNIAIQEFVAYFFVLVICRSFYQQRLKEARATIDADMSQNLFGAASRLLSMIYDVVVEIDEARLVIGQATNLAGMLLHGANRSLEGKCLVDFILPGRDRKLFEDMLSSSSSAPVKLRLKDTAGTVLHVEMFHARYNNMKKLKHHMIGIRELEAHAIAPDLARHPHLTSLCGLDKSADLPQVARAVPQYREQGTRAQIEAADLGETTQLSTDSLSSRKSRSEPSTRPLLLPEHNETSSKARNLSLLSTLARWNVQIPVVHCCSYHAALLESRDTLRHLQNLRCRELRGMCLPWQCPQCGLLSEDVDSAKYIDGEGCLICTERCRDGSRESKHSPCAKVSL